MEIEYQDTNRRGKMVIAAGIVLAIVAGAGAFFAISQAQQHAGQGELQRVPVVVAARDIPARKPIETGDIALREVPLDASNERGIFSNPDLVVGRILAVTVLEGQLVTSNLLASEASGGQFSIVDPTSSYAPELQPWRAVSLVIPDERAVGGMIAPNQAVDVIVTTLVNVPQDVVEQGRYYTDKSTKIIYQDMVILAKSSSTYIVRASIPTAEEIVHLQASGTALFSLILRPPVDTHIVDAGALGATTNRIITKYGLPLPETYPAGGPLPTSNDARAPQPSDIPEVPPGP